MQGLELSNTLNVTNGISMLLTLLRESNSKTCK